MNRIVLRYADVMLERAEALVQLNDGRIDEPSVCERPAPTRQAKLRGHCQLRARLWWPTERRTYIGTYNQAEAIKIVKMERRLELGMECERFFDLVRWARPTACSTSIMPTKQRLRHYSAAQFTKNKNEYLPIPYAQLRLLTDTTHKTLEDGNHEEVYFKPYTVCNSIARPHGVQRKPGI
jgi:hypothetical protein